MCFLSRLGNARARVRRYNAVELDITMCKKGELIKRSKDIVKKPCNITVSAI